jgi:toxin ParE1/3/4
MARGQKAILFSRRADKDFDDIIDFLHERTSCSPRFVEALNHCLRDVASMPDLGSVHFSGSFGIAKVRTYKIPHFPYIVVYSSRTTCIEVVRILHTSRDIWALLPS